jgi:hypothetical protein
MKQETSTQTERAPGSAARESPPEGAHAVPGRPARPGAPVTVPGRATIASAAAPPPAESGGGAPLPADVRATMEASFATDLGAVRIHQDGAAAALGAIAYTRGDDIHFAPGAYDPGSTSGRELLGHELAHVVQQRRGRAPAARGALAVDPSLEAEADDHGRRAARGEIVASAPTAARTPSGTAAQPKLGFEIELNVLVSRKVGVTQDEPAETLPVGKPGDIRWVDRKGYRWRDELSRQDTTEHCIIPNDYSGKGGWTHWAEWDGRGTTGTDEDEYCDPMISKESFFRGTAVQAKVDHAPTLFGVGARNRHAIVELVTDAKEETAPDFLEPMKEAVDLAGKMQRKVVDGKARLPVADVLGSTLDGALYLGAQLGTEEPQFQNLYGYVQQTFGLRLGSVSSFMQQRVMAHGSSSRDGDVYSQTLGAMSKLDGLLAKFGITQQDTPHLYGYLALACLYLVGGRLPTSGSGKNAVPLLVREHFDAVRGKTVPPNEVKQLAETSVVLQLKDAMLDATGRGTGDPLYKMPTAVSKITAGEWLLAVLLGDRDRVWDEWDSTRPVESEPVGEDREQAPVVEERNVPGTQMRVLPDQWIELAASHATQIGQFNAAPRTPTPVTAKLNREGTSSTSNDNSNDNSNDSPPKPQLVKKPLGDAEVQKGQTLALDDGTLVTVKVASGKTHVWVMKGATPTNVPRTDLYLV